jgi:hypothetical protein
MIELAFTSEESRDLVAALSRHCTCVPHDQAGVIECPGHRSLSEQSDLKHLLFARRMREVWQMREFSLGSRMGGVKEWRDRDSDCFRVRNGS